MHQALIIASVPVHAWLGCHVSNSQMYMCVLHVANNILVCYFLRHKLKYKQVEQQNIKLEEEKEQLQVSEIMSYLLQSNYHRCE